MVDRISLATRAFPNIVVAEALLLALLVGLVWGFQPEAFVSAVWGGLVFLLPNAYFTYYAFRYSGKNWGGLAVLSLFRGQVGKMLLTAAGFALAFNFARPLYVTYIFGVYSFLLIAHLFIVAKFDRQHDLSRSKSFTK